MKRQNRLMLLPLFFLVASCGSAPAATPEPTPTVADAAPAENDKIEGLVLPAQQSTMSFLLDGNLAEILVKEGDLVRAGDALAILSTPELDSAVLEAEASLRAAEADLKYWLVARKHKPPERRWLAEDRVDAAKAAVETALANQKQKTLIAPYQATVIEINASAGEVLSAYQSVILLADLSNLEIETSDLSERDVVDLSIGQRAFVYIEALDTELEGQITTISPVSVEKSGDVTYTTTIKLDETPKSLRWGMSVTVEFELE